MVFFFRKNRKNFSCIFGFAHGPYLSNLALSNCSKNVLNAIQIALKWLLFSEKLQELPSGWGLSPPAPIGVNCYLARNLHNQQLLRSLLYGFWINKCCNDATITTKPCLTRTKLPTIGYWWLFEKFKSPSLKVSGCAPAYVCA